MLVHLRSLSSGVITASYVLDLHHVADEDVILAQDLCLQFSFRLQLLSLVFQVGWCSRTLVLECGLHTFQSFEMHLVFLPSRGLLVV